MIYTRSMLYLMHVMFLSILTELWPLIDVRILFLLNILWINLWISIKMIEQYLSFFSNKVMALDWCRNFVYTQYLVDQLMDFDKNL